MATVLLIFLIVFDLSACVLAINIAVLKYSSTILKVRTKFETLHCQTAKQFLPHTYYF